MSNVSKGLQPNPELIEYLEEKLALAKEGKIISMVNVMLEKEDYEAPVLPSIPAIFVRSAEDVATLKMVYDAMVADELNRTWLLQMGYIGVDDE
jgi:hypothetical protein